MPQRFSVERAGRRFRVRELVAGGSRVSRGTFATEGEARARAAALEATPPAPEAPVSMNQPTPAWMPGTPPDSGPAASPPPPEAPPPSTSPAGDDPFADAPRDQAQPSSAEAQEVETAPAASGPTRLGEAGARAYLPLLYGMADTVSCAGATWLLNRKLGEEGAKRFLQDAHAVMRLSDVEKAALEAPLVHKLAQVELSPDDALLLAVLGIYAAKLVSMQSMVSQAEAQVVTVEPVP